ncbi:hypothetical protein LCM02_03965 [Lutimonas saemankumensis]|uniref:hypothetical protein n=1 Tax=Lutimonas saemankumensis TaxID=483016 RepID=UPI001CD738BF|nr:hypothetical protein [Lutimonas saemankumensis]MCA0931596.1 hypothetical protein [Lutimonas saemankumensis]
MILSKYELTYLSKVLLTLIAMFLVFMPYMRIMVSGAPIYVYIIFLLLLVSIIFIVGRAKVLQLPTIQLTLVFLNISFLVTFINFVLDPRGVEFRIFIFIQKSVALSSIVLLPLLYFLTPNNGINSYAKKVFLLFGTLSVLWGIFQVMDFTFIRNITNYYYFDLNEVNAKYYQGQGYYGVKRAIAGMWNSNVYGPVLVMIFPLLVYTNKFYFKNLIIALWLIGTIFSGSRQVFLVLIIYGIIFSIYEFKIKYKNYLFGSILLGVITIIFLNMEFEGKSTLLRGIGYTEQGINYSSGVQERAGGYFNFGTKFVDEPFRFFLGDGLGNREAKTRTGSDDFVFVSNSFLLSLIDNGVLGILIYIGIITSTILLCIKHSIKWGVMTLSGIFIFHLTDNAMYASPIVFTLWCLLISMMLNDCIYKINGSLD